LLDFVAGVRQQGGITVRFVGAPPNRHGLGLADGGGIENPQPDEHGARVLRPSDTQFYCGCTVRRTVEPHYHKHPPRHTSRNVLPVKRIDGSLLMGHQYLACALVYQMEMSKTSSRANAVLHHPPEAFNRVEVVPTMGG